MFLLCTEWERGRESKQAADCKPRATEAQTACKLYIYIYISFAIVLKLIFVPKTNPYRTQNRQIRNGEDLSRKICRMAQEQYLKRPRRPAGAVSMAFCLRRPQRLCSVSRLIRVGKTLFLIRKKKRKKEMTYPRRPCSSPEKKMR